MDTHVTIPMARLVQLETAEQDRDLLSRQLQCVREARRGDWRAVEHGFDDSEPPND